MVDTLVQRYRPDTGDWVPAGSLLGSGGVPTLLPNGKLLVTGLSPAELYDPATDSSTPTGAMIIPRTGHQATVLVSGDVLVSGGFDAGNQLVGPAELYHPSSGTFTITGVLNNPRASHTALLLPTGQVLAAGGHGGAGGNVALSSAELYDPTSQTWAFTNPMDTVRSEAFGVLLPNGKALVAGVVSSQLYDSATTTWSPSVAFVDNSGFNFLASALGLLNNGQALVLLSSSGLCGPRSHLIGANLFDATAGAWVMTSQPQDLEAPSMTALPDGRMLVAGAVAGCPAGFTAQLFRPDNTTPRLSLSPTAVDFGNVPIGSSVQRPVIVQNTGQAHLNGSVTLSGSSKFSIAAGATFSLDQAASSSTVVAFDASAFGSFFGTALFMSNGGWISVPLTGVVALELSGRITRPDGSGMPSVTVELHGASSASTVTDAAGDYSFFVQPNASYTVVPASATLTFTPPSRSVSAGTTNVSGLDFMASAAPTTTTLASSANPSLAGQAVTFTATVNGGAAAGAVPTGTVTFRDGTTVLGIVSLNALHQAALTTSTLAVGAHSITGQYGGDTNFTGSTSAALSQTVNKATTTTTVGSSANPALAGNTVTFTATVNVAAPGSGTPTGTVTFKDGTTTLGTGAVNGSGQATLSTSALAIGPHAITAEYGGDVNFNGSPSSTLTQTVNGNTSTSLSSSANPSIVGQSVTFLAAVSVNGGGGGVPTGTVTFREGVTVLGTGSLDAMGQATLTTSTLALGAHSITAEYAGDATFNASTSPALTQTVKTSVVPAADFDGDGKRDVAVYRPSTGEWFILGSATGSQTRLFGSPSASGLGDAPVPADFDGDRKTDLAIFRQATGEWIVFGSTSGFQTFLFGAPAASGLGDTPVTADYDGDGKADLAVYRKATGEWLIFGSATGFQTVLFGAPAASGLGDIPVTADYDGDGKADLAVYRKATGQWFIFGSATGFQTVLFGAPAASGLGDIPVPADYDGDGKADIAIYRQATGEWLIFGSASGFQRVLFGAPASTGFGDIPVPGDFDGDGRADLAVRRTATGQWLILQSSTGQTQTVTWGALSDLPLPSPAQ
ncbi:MAG TPA: Ig-like domain repeat protein [Candidatus Acidoferrum sp.]|nr:Ig-like domain repeat protein [Candidatus Acidoferrum sp.]